MSNATPLRDQLKIAAATLFSLAGAQSTRVAARIAALDLLIYEAAAREHRRAAFNRRDKACYRLGSAFEPTNGLDLDPVNLTGFLHLGATALLLLAEHAIERPELSIVDLLGRLFRSPAGRVIRAHGIWVRWNWLRALYVAETETFLASRKGRDPKARWRADKPTTNQTYIAAEICLDLQLEPRTFANRGEAFDWIKVQAGNPRFNKQPSRPDLTQLVEMLR